MSSGTYPRQQGEHYQLSPALPRNIIRNCGALHGLHPRNRLRLACCPYFSLSSSLLSPILSIKALLRHAVRPIGDTALCIAGAAVCHEVTVMTKNPAVVLMRLLLELLDLEGVVCAADPC